MYSQSYESSSGAEDSTDFDDDECGIGIVVTQQKGQFKVASMDPGLSACLADLRVCHATSGPDTTSYPSRRSC